LHLIVSINITTAIKTVAIKNTIMKKRIFALALIIGAAVVSVTSGCYVGYGHPYHHHYYRGY
jgi:hypothetical protein